MFKVPRQVYDVFLRDLTALADSNTTLTLSYMQFSAALNLFSQYEIHTKPFYHLINRFCNIRLLLLFQVMVSPYKLPCLRKRRQSFGIQNFIFLFQQMSV